MKKIISIIALIVLTTPLLSCGVSQKAEQQYQQELQQYQQQVEKATHENQRQDILYWARIVSGIMENDAQLSSWWKDLQASYAATAPTAEAKQNMVNQTSAYQKRYDSLYVATASLKTPDACSTAQQLLLLYLDKTRQAAASFLSYYQTSNTKYQDNANSLVAEGDLAHEQFGLEYNKIVEDWDLAGDLES